MFPEPCCLHLLSPRLRYIEYLLSRLIPMPWASLSLVTTVQLMGTRLCRRERVCNFLSREPEATVVSSLQGGPAIARRHCFLQEAGLARKCQSIATETTVRRKHKGSLAFPETLIFPYSDHITNTFSTYGCKYPPHSHLRLICSSHIF